MDPMTAPLEPFTGETITDDTIRRVWALLWSADWPMTALCQVALNATGEQRAEARSKLADALNAARNEYTRLQPVVTLPDLDVTDGATGIRTSQLTTPAQVDRITVSGPGSVGIDLDDE